MVDSWDEMHEKNIVERDADACSADGGQSDGDGACSCRNGVEV